MNWHLFIRLGWVIPLCILLVYFIIGLSIILFIDRWIEFYARKSKFTTNPELKHRYKENLIQLIGIKFHLLTIKFFLKSIFKIK